MTPLALSGAISKSHRSKYMITYCRPRTVRVPRK